MPIRRRYHFHTPGLVYVFITLLTALGAMNSQNNLLFWAFGFALAILIVSGLISGQMLMGIRAERVAPARGVVGEPLALSYRVTNRSRVAPAFAIGISELGQGGAGEGGGHEERKEGWGRALRAVRRAVGLGWGRGGVRAYGFLVHLGPRESAEVSARLTPARRGMLRLGEFSFDTAFPFGLVRKSLLFRQERAVLVRPRAIAPPAGLLARRPRGMQGATPRAARPGGGEEFFTLREYVPGDSPRTISWRASARRGGMAGAGRGGVVVRQNSEPTPRRMLVLLRLDPAEGERANEDAISLAAGVISAGAGAGYDVGMVVPWAGLERRPSQGKAQCGRLLDDLALIDLRAPAPRQTPAPAGVPQGTLVVAVHAGMVRGGFGPAGAVHLGSTREHEGGGHAAGAEGPRGPAPSQPAPVGGNGAAAHAAANGTRLNGTGARGSRGKGGAR